MSDVGRNNARREWNFRAALAGFVTEHLPVDDPYTDEMNDAAWRIADRLEGRFYEAFAEEVPASGTRADEVRAVRSQKKGEVCL